MALPSRLVSRVTWWRRAAVSRPWNDKVRVLFFVNKGQRHYIPSTQSNIFVSPLVLFRVLERMVSSRRSCNQVGGHRTGMSSGFFVMSMFNAIERKSFAFLKVDYDFRDFGETRAPFASYWQGHVIATPSFGLWSGHGWCDRHRHVLRTFCKHAAFMVLLPSAGYC